MPETLDPYWYAREHDGSGWSVRGPDGFALKMPPDRPLDKNIAFVIAKLLSGKITDADMLLHDLVKFIGPDDAPGTLEAMKGDLNAGTIRGFG